MKRTVSQERRPDPLELYVDTGEVKDEALTVADSLSSQGYGEDFMYQVGTVAPPLTGSEDLIEGIGDNFAYVTVRGVGDEGVRDEQFAVDYGLSNKNGFRRTVEGIEDAVEATGFELDHWSIGSVMTSSTSGLEAVEALEGMEIGATAAVDAGLESQRGDAGFQPITVGWFRKAPMNSEMQFGYRAFPNREFQHDEQKNYEASDDLVEDILGRVTGLRDDEVNMHALDDSELEALLELENEMQDKGLM